MRVPADGNLGKHEAAGHKVRGRQRSSRYLRIEIRKDGNLAAADGLVPGAMGGTNVDGAWMWRWRSWRGGGRGEVEVELEAEAETDSLQIGIRRTAKEWASRSVRVALRWPNNGWTRMARASRWLVVEGGERGKDHWSGYGQSAYQVPAVRVVTVVVLALQQTRRWELKGSRQTLATPQRRTVAQRLADGKDRVEGEGRMGTMGACRSEYLCTRTRALTSEISWE